MTASNGNGQLPLADPEQQAFACESEHRLIALVSPPGTGKTTAQVTRFLKLVDEGMNPQRIVMITFTNRARDAFCEQLRKSGAPFTEAIVPPELRSNRPWDAPSPLWIGTLHDIAGRINRCHLGTLGFRHPVRIVNQEQSRIRWRKALAEHGQLPSGAEEAEKMTEALAVRIGQWKRAGVDPRESKWNDGIARSCTGTLPFIDANWQRIAGTYQTGLARENAWDFDDIPLYACRMMKHCPEIAEAWGARFDSILVDECQDCEPLLIELVQHIGLNASIAFSGDPDQTIYDFRNVVGFKGLEFLRRSHGTVDLHTLRHDYRLARPIQHAANSLRAKMSEPGAAPNPTERNGWSAPTHVMVEHERELAQRVATAIDHTIRNEGGPYAGPGATPDDTRRSSYRECVVTARTNRELGDLARELVTYNIPVWVVREESKSSCARGFLAWLRAACDPCDENIEEACGLVPFTLPRSALANARKRSIARRVPLANELGGETDPESPLHRIAAHLAALAPWQTGTGKSGLAELVNEIETRFGFVELVAEQSRQEQEAYQQSVALARRIARRSTTPQQIAFAIAQPRENEPGEAMDHVQIRTMHSLKGHQLRHVFAVRWHEGHFPLNENEIESNRRLAYTTLTRASRTFQSFSARTGTAGTPLAVSRFVHEGAIEVAREGP